MRRCSFPGHLRPQPQPSPSLPFQGRGRCILSRAPVSASLAPLASSRRNGAPWTSINILYYISAPPKLLSLFTAAPRSLTRLHQYQPYFGAKCWHRCSAHPPPQNQLKHPTSGHRSGFRCTRWGSVFFTRKQASKKKKNSNCTGRPMGKEREVGGGRAWRAGRARGLVPQGIRENAPGARFRALFFFFPFPPFPPKPAEARDSA